MKMSGVLIQAWQMAANGVLHRIALRCLAKLQAETNARTWALRPSRSGQWNALVASLTVRFMRSA